jgi:aspartate oxidase
MMDELLQFHIITPNQKGKAIWDCKLSGLSVWLNITRAEFSFIAHHFISLFNNMNKMDLSIFKNKYPM